MKSQVFLQGNFAMFRSSIHQIGRRGCPCPWAEIHGMVRAIAHPTRLAAHSLAEHGEVALQEH